MVRGSSAVAASVWIATTALLVALLLGSPLHAAPKHASPKPTSVVLLIDHSGSMQGEKLDATKDAVLAALDSLDSRGRLSLVVFDTDVKIVFTEVARSQRSWVKKTVSQLQAGGGTNIKPGLEKAFEILKGLTKRKHVILLSDGEAPSDGLAELADEMAKTDITISAIGVHGSDRNLLATITDHGGGRLYMVEDLKSLPKVFAKELAEATR